MKWDFGDKLAFCYENCFFFLTYYERWLDCNRKKLWKSLEANEIGFLVGGEL